MTQQIVRIDGVKWWMTKSQEGTRLAVPLCPDHNLRASPLPQGQVRNSSNTGWRKRFDNEALSLECAEGPHILVIPREFEKERQYVYDRIDAKLFAEMPTLDLDGELTPVAKEKLKNGKYFLTGQIMESKRGLQVVLYAGEKGRSGKAQIFIEPGTKKMSFDHKDLSPVDIFTKITATFDTGTSQVIQRGDEK